MPYMTWGEVTSMHSTLVAERKQRCSAADEHTGAHNHTADRQLAHV